MSDLQSSVPTTEQGVIKKNLPMAAHYPDRRKRIYHALDELIDKRQVALLAYTRLAALDSFEDIETIRMDLRVFCQALLDYAALEQFEIFNAYCSQQERRQEFKTLARRHYPSLSEMNARLVAFNDKYDGSEPQGNIGELSEDLYKIGDLLSQRVEEEDRFINSMLKD